jgi:hypothetical protein
MKHFRSTKPTLLIAGLLSGLLFATMAAPLGAQPASESRLGRGFGPVYDAARETTINGTIQKVVTKHTVGSPAGMHLLVTGPQGLVNAHVGSFLNKQTTASLQAGMPVRIVGANVSLHGKNYFLARELTVGGRTVTVRSERGILIRAHSARVARTRSQPSSQPGSTGGAR